MDKLNEGSSRKGIIIMNVLSPFLEDIFGHQALNVYNNHGSKIIHFNLVLRKAAKRSFKSSQKWFDRVGFERLKVKDVLNM